MTTRGNAIGPFVRTARIHTAIVTVVWLGACAGEDPAPTVAPSPVLTEAEASRARETYLQESCEICHGEQTEGVDGAGPALGDLAPYWSEERLVGYLEDPAAFREANPEFEDRRATVFDIEMPSFEHVPVEERRLLARWLLTR